MDFIRSVVAILVCMVAAVVADQEFAEEWVGTRE